jgi:hypothetical protein
MVPALSLAYDRPYLNNFCSEVGLFSPLKTNVSDCTYGHHSYRATNIYFRLALLIFDSSVITYAKAKRCDTPSYACLVGHSRCKLPLDISGGEP